MLKAIIFDCDGVIVNSEPHHLKGFQRVLAEEGIALTEAEYNKTYLAMDDKGCFETILARYGRPTDKATIKRLIHTKMAIYKTLAEQESHIYPGVFELVKALEGKVPLAIASGAFRSEIKFALDQAHIRSAFPIIVSAQDVKHGKPHPEAFLTALSQINIRYGLPKHLPSQGTLPARGASPLISPNECVVIEDSVHGVGAAKAAGMKSVAVTNSYSKEVLLPLADYVVQSLTEVHWEALERLCKTD
jgi:beta-phosphoglucomutase-like phosphatase (HAD superfamily)